MKKTAFEKRSFETAESLSHHLGTLGHFVPPEDVVGWCTVHLTMTESESIEFAEQVEQTIEKPKANKAQSIIDSIRKLTHCTKQTPLLDVLIAVEKDLRELSLR